MKYYPSQASSDSVCSKTAKKEHKIITHVIRLYGYRGSKVAVNYQLVYKIAGLTCKLHCSAVWIGLSLRSSSVSDESWKTLWYS